MMDKPIVVFARRPTAYARQIVSDLAARGLPVTKVFLGSRVEQISGPIEKIMRVRRQLGVVEAWHYIRRLSEKGPSAQLPDMPTLAEHGGFDIDHYDTINGGQVLSELARLAPAIVVLAGTGVVDAAFLAANRGGHVVNGHPAILPGVRGVDVIEWALAEGRPTGVSAHLVTTAVDAGDILVSEEVPVLASDADFAGFLHRVIGRQADAVVEAVAVLAAGREPHRPHDPAKSVLRLTAPRSIHEKAMARFEELRSSVAVNTAA
jgi:folate-dependent phosphoribosylglycinamide formyltransferase PurN